MKMKCIFFFAILIQSIMTVAVQDDDYSIDDESPLLADSVPEPPIEDEVEYIADGQKMVADPLPWPNATVYYAISRDFSDRESALIVAMMKLIEAKSCVKFVRELGQASYIDIQRKSDTQPCNAKVGFITTGGPRKVNLDIHCLNENGILHELMHSLGFYHEHNRYDRDNYITINYNNIDRKSHKKFNPRSSLEQVLVGIGYDFNSITHYEKYALAVNKSQPTIIAKRGEEIKNDKLSEKDVQKINLLYKCDGYSVPISHTTQVAHVYIEPRTSPRRTPVFEDLSCQGLGGTCKHNDGVCEDDGKTRILYNYGCQKRFFPSRGYSSELCCASLDNENALSCQALGGKCKHTDGTCMDEGKRRIRYNFGCQKRNFPSRGYASEYCCG